MYHGWADPVVLAMPAGTPTAKYVFDLLESQRPLFQQCRMANFGSVTMSDYSCPGLELARTVREFNRDMEAVRKATGLSPPRMKLATALPP